jgi:hypothetical protein
VAQAEVGIVVDLDAADAERLPPPEALQTSILGVKIPRIPVANGFSPLPLVVAALTTACGLKSLNDSADCFKGIGNHITPHSRPNKRARLPLLRRQIPGEPYTSPLARGLWMVKVARSCGAPIAPARSFR